MTSFARWLVLAVALAAAAAGGAAARPASTADTPLPVEPLQPSLAGATGWLGSQALTLEQLRGKVVLVDFWTYSCINCLRTLPAVRAWARAYASQGLVVIGVHAPEFEFEHDPQRVRKALVDSMSTGPSRSTTTSRSGAASTTRPGPRCTSSTRRAACATTCWAKAATTSPNA